MFHFARLLAVSGLLLLTGCDAEPDPDAPRAPLPSEIKPQPPGPATAPKSLQEALKEFRARRPRKRPTRQRKREPPPRPPRSQRPQRLARATPQTRTQPPPRTRLLPPTPRNQLQLLPLALPRPHPRQIRRKVNQYAHLPCSVGSSLRTLRGHPKGPTFPLQRPELVGWVSGA